MPERLNKLPDDGKSLFPIVRNRFKQQAPVLLQLRREGDGGLQEPDELLMHGILDKARQYGWKLLNLELNQGVIPTEPPPLGAIVRSLPDEPLARQLREIGCPTVRIGNFPHPRDDLLPAVLHDFPAAGRLAANHFYERQFEHVGFVARDPWGDSQPLYEAFRQRIDELGRSCHILRIQQQGGADPVARYKMRQRQAAAWLEGIPKPIGIFAHNDPMAGTICTWCQEAQLRVPEDVAILGRGNNRFACESAPVLLSSVDMNNEELGHRAMDLLHQLIRGAALPPLPVMVPPGGVVERHSTDILAVVDPIVARALRFLWDHLHEPLHVDQVADRMAISRRKLERAFNKSLGRGINAELRRKRLELVRELLSSTDMSIAEIANATGIGTSIYLHRTFKRQFGLTPRQFRLQRQAGSGNG